MIRQRLTKTITANYTVTLADCGYKIICNSSSAIIITLPSATGMYNFDLKIINAGAGTVTCTTKAIEQGQELSISNLDGASWILSVGGGASSGEKSKTINVGSSYAYQTIQSALDSLGKQLSGNILIYVQTNYVETQEYVEVFGFYGTGSLSIYGIQGSEKIIYGMYLENNTIPVINVKFLKSADTFYVDNNLSFVRLSYINSTNAYTLSNSYGFEVMDSSSVDIDHCIVSGYEYAFENFHTSLMSVGHATTSNVDYVFSVYGGSIVEYGDFELLSYAFNIEFCNFYYGILQRSDGSILPLQAKKQDYMADWDASEIFNTYDWCMYNGFLYKSLQDSNINHNPASEILYWEPFQSGEIGINWRGNWSSESTYNAREAISYAGSSYICHTPNTNQVPPNISYWNVISLKGDTGDIWSPPKGTHTIPITGWQDTIDKQYLKKINIAVPGVTNDSFVFVQFPQDSIQTTLVAQFWDGVEIATDTLTFYANNIPTSEITFTYGRL